MTVHTSDTLSGSDGQVRAGIDAIAGVEEDWETLGEEDGGMDKGEDSVEEGEGKGSVEENVPDVSVEVSKENASASKLTSAGTEILDAKVCLHCHARWS
jgi:hypothetical protein